MKIKWKTIEGHEKYEVSNTGLVREKQSGRLVRIKKGRRYHVDFTKAPISRLVAIAFLPNPQKLPNVIHVNGIQENNDVHNLRWASKEETVYHNRFVSNEYGEAPNPRKKPVKATWKPTGSSLTFASITECARELWLHRRVIQDSLKHPTLKQCADWEFCYA